MSHVELKLIEL